MDQTNAQTNAKVKRSDRFDAFFNRKINILFPQTLSRLQTLRRQTRIIMDSQA